MIKKLQLTVTTSIINLALVLGFSGTAYAWHPQAMITKSEQDSTTSSNVVSATAAVSVDQKTDNETAQQILTVSSGDSLSYTITVKNPANTAANKDNDLANVVVTDYLPAGVSLASNPSETQIVEKIDDLAPQQSKTYHYSVTVTDKTSGDILTNKACIEGSSANNDVTGLLACSSVSIKVNVPSYSCDVLTLSQGSNRTVTITKLDTTANNGANFKSATINWGDNSAVLTTANPVNQSHQYTTDGTYKVSATAHFTVNGVDKTATSNACVATATFTTPTPPQTLPNTGMGNLVIPVGLTSLTGYGLYLANWKRRIAKN